MVAAKYFSPAQEDQMVSAIQAAELNTSGEIRVHIDKICKGDALDEAAWLFKKLKMHKTALRNGVLIYVAIESKKFAIIGDSGINALVPDNFWEETKTQMLASFTQGQYTEGIANACESVGLLLKKHFPYQSGDINELSDTISFGKK
ncbi:MAG: TPM domain-containing protein [Bacteroidales bacterium]